MDEVPVQQTEEKTNPLTTDEVLDDDCTNHTSEVKAEKRHLEEAKRIEKKVKKIKFPKNPTSEDFKVWSILKRLYKGVPDGFGISREEEMETSGKDLRLLDGFGSATYGEVRPISVPHVISLLGVNNQDIFFDFGSGVGKMVFQVALSTNCKKAVGIELSQSRYEASMKALQRLDGLKKEGVIQNLTEIVFKNEDVLDADLSEATLIMYSNVCFPTSITEGLLAKMAFAVQDGTRMLTLRKICSRCSYLCRVRNKYCSLWTLIKESTIQCTWTESCTAYIYQKRWPS